MSTTKEQRRIDALSYLALNLSIRKWERGSRAYDDGLFVEWWDLEGCRTCALCSYSKLISNTNGFSLCPIKDAQYTCAKPFQVIEEVMEYGVSSLSTDIGSAIKEMLTMLYTKLEQLPELGVIEDEEIKHDLLRLGFEESMQKWWRGYIVDMVTPEFSQFWWDTEGDKCCGLCYAYIVLSNESHCSTMVCASCCLYDPEHPPCCKEFPSEDDIQQKGLKLASLEMLHKLKQTMDAHNILPLSDWSPPCESA